MSFLAAFGRYPELARRDGAQLLAKHRRALATERRLELHLRLAPQPARNTKPLGTCPGQMQFLAAAIQASVLYADEAVTLQWKHGPSQCRAIHYELACERVDRKRSQPFQLRQDRKLRRAQAGGSQALVVELGDVAGRLAQRQTIALR